MSSLLSIRTAGATACVVLLLLATACPRTPAGPRRPSPEAPFTLEDVQEQGDERRQASTHLVREGLRDDAADAPDRALDRYRMALRVDPSNPWAYLALARHELDRDEPRRALAALERSRSLLELEGPPPARVEAHLVGLHGAVLEALGRHEEAQRLLAEARDRAPGVWSDGHLHPDELR